MLNFFHRVASTRKQINRIDKLQQHGGNWVETQAKISNVVLTYFEDIFEAGSISENLEDALSCVQLNVTVEDNIRLIADFTFEEFTIAIN